MSLSGAGWGRAGRCSRGTDRIALLTRRRGGANTRLPSGIHRPFFCGRAAAKQRRTDHAIHVFVDFVRILYRTIVGSNTIKRTRSFNSVDTYIAIYRVDRDKDRSDILVIYCVPGRSPTDRAIVGEKLGDVRYVCRERRRLLRPGAPQQLVDVPMSLEIQPHG